MLRLIEEKRYSIEQLCREHNVRRMEIFGSAVDGRFDSKTSDLDFIVSFGELAPTDYAEAYFGVLEGFQELFQRPVDLLTEPSIKNPYFLSEIQKTRTVLCIDIV